MGLLTMQWCYGRSVKGMHRQGSLNGHSFAVSGSGQLYTSTAVDIWSTGQSWAVMILANQWVSNAKRLRPPAEAAPTSGWTWLSVQPIVAAHLLSIKQSHMVIGQACAGNVCSALARCVLSIVSNVSETLRIFMQFNWKLSPKLFRNCCTKLLKMLSNMTKISKK